MKIESSMIVILCIQSILSFFYLYFITDLQPTPYMDEYFHLYQTQTYCNLSSFNITSFQNLIQLLIHPPFYHPSISTPPLYYFLASKLFRFCSLFHLRLFSVCSSIFNSALSYSIYSSIRNQYNHKIPHFQPFLLSQFIIISPVLSFYTAFAYTDQFAVTLFLIAIRTSILCFTIEEHSIFCEILSSLCFLSVAIGVRQTFIIWHAGFVAFLIFMIPSKLHKDITERKENSNSNQTFRHFSILHQHVSKKWILLKLLWPHVIAGLSYVLWLKLRHGMIPFGHSEHHQVSFHPSMLLYFAIYRLFVSFPSFSLFSSVSKFIRFKFHFFLIQVLICACIVIFNVNAHPFVLSDNRHYTFYIYRKILLSNSFRGALLRVCVLPILSWIGMYSLYLDLGMRYGSIFVTFTSIALIPIGLLEPRYFIAPLILSNIMSFYNLSQNQPEFRRNSQSKLTVKMHSRSFFRWSYYMFYLFLQMQSISLAFVFLFLPFHPHAQENSTGRFMP